MSLGNIWFLVKRTFSEWSADNVSRLSAALAYYAMFAIAPLLVIAIAVAGFVWGKQAAASNQVHDQLTSLVGENGASMVQTMVAKAGEHRSGVIATIIGVVLLLIGSTGAFVELQSSLDAIWGVERKPSGTWGLVRSRLSSFLLVLVIILLLLASLVASAVLSAMRGYIGYSELVRVLNAVVSLAVVTVLFAMVFKVLPDVQMRWKDVWIGAFATAILFTIGKYLIGLYLARGTVSSVFGTAGSLVAVLVWVYYSAQILFLGAEFTKVYARWSGAQIRPSPEAQPAERPARTKAATTEPAETTVRQPIIVQTAPTGHRSMWRVMVPLVAGAVAGRLLPRGTSPKPSRATTRRFAGKRILEPGWSSRDRG